MQHGFGAAGAALGLLLISGTSAAAQNAAAADSPGRWNVAAEMSYTDQSGNKVLRLLTGGLKLAHREKEHFELDGRVQSRYGKSDGQVIARNHYASLALDLRPKERWSPFLFFNAERDELRRLDMRFNGGAGARYTIHYDAAAKNNASVSLALLHSFEDIRRPDSPADVDPGSRHLARMSLRLVGNQRVREGLTLHHTSFYQPAVEQMADYLLRSDTGAKVMLTRRLALNVGYQLSRTNRPPEGVAPDDRLFKTGFIIDF